MKGTWHSVWCFKLKYDPNFSTHHFCLWDFGLVKSEAVRVETFFILSGLCFIRVLGGKTESTRNWRISPRLTGSTWRLWRWRTFACSCTFAGLSIPYCASVCVKQPGQINHSYIDRSCIPNQSAWSNHHSFWFFTTLCSLILRFSWITYPSVVLEFCVSCDRGYFSNDIYKLYAPDLKGRFRPVLAH